ncbi:MAG: alpha/beta fold hydrolase [Nitrospira sp.]|jgi:esterase/lipase superfamily enzyme|nr:alpha/beta fold hydrolase [Nitrospira sp. BO4]
MTALRLFYATNRNHLGNDRWHPDGYGKKFSDDGVENLRFGRVTVEADDAKMAKYLEADCGTIGQGDGEGLIKYLAKCAESAKIVAYKEKINRSVAEDQQENVKLGSDGAFSDLQAIMRKNTDVLIFIHGYNVSWTDAVGTALSLQEMLNHCPEGDPEQAVQVVLFTWPSDGMALPFVSYKSDRSEAAGSGNAVGRGILKVRDFLAALRRDDEQLCKQDLHLVCHSMGNYLLQNAVTRCDAFTPGNALPRLFEHIFLCSPDVDDNVLEEGHPLGRVHELARSVSVYYNRGDAALVISDFTKGNPDRLGSNGPARPSLVHNKVNQIDCSGIVKGLVEHSYYLVGNVNGDIRMSIDGMPHEDPRRRRNKTGTMGNQWEMRPA